MSRIISRAESWERTYEAFNNVNFSAFDYDTIKASMLEYLKLYFPEDFNDYIESSELISLLELFSYMGEQLSYRLDMNAHENFLSTAQRKESVLRLAKLISYNPSRNITSRGLVKITTISTTETIFDSNGVNLTNRTIRWDDASNTTWKDQFLLVMNRVLNQEFGSVSPENRVQIDDVLFELYSLNNNTINNGVFPYTAVVSGESIPMELTPVALNELGPYERRPEIASNFSMLYGADGLGDGSTTTGFFMFTKQGNLQVLIGNFDGITPNQTLDVTVDNINETDIWLNNIDPNSNTLDIIDDGTSPNGRSGEWSEVDLAFAQNIIFNTNPNRNKYEVETLNDDQIRIIFGDGEFADIPSGAFHIWFRTSLNRDIIIPQNSVSNQTSTFTYQGLDGNVQTLTFTFSLINALQNGAPSEDIEHVRRTAPAVYYTQDRMVNNQDYNTFMLQDSSILKLRAVNRTYAGDSKYIDWHDPRETYENVKLFGDDLAIYFKDSESSTEVSGIQTTTQAILNQIQPLLSTTDFFTIFTSSGIAPGDIRREFNTIETTNLTNALDLAILSPPTTIELFFNHTTYVLSGALPIVTVFPHDVLYGDITPQGDVDNTFTLAAYYNNILIPTPVSTDVIDELRVTVLGANTTITFGIDQWSVDSTFGVNTLLTTTEPMISIVTNTATTWTITHKTRRLVSESQATRFWNTNNANRVIFYDSLKSTGDKIIVLQANPRDTGTTLLSQNWNFDVLGQETIDSGLPDSGLPNINQLSILPEDISEDNIPDNMTLDEIINPTYIVSQAPSTFNLPRIALFGDIVFDVSSFDVYYEGVLIGNNVTPPNMNALVDQIVVTALGAGNTFTVADYVMFMRENITSKYLPMLSTEENMNAYVFDLGVPVNNRLWQRSVGRYPLNFAWFHRTTSFNLVDPSSTNIIDMFIITRGYYSAIIQWLYGNTNIEPVPPTSLDLRVAYSKLLDNKMISDTLILHPGKFKYMFGALAHEELRATFKVIRSSTGVLTNNQLKVRIVQVIKDFFDISRAEFGETFYYTELSTSIHNVLLSEIDSIVLVPTHTQNQFGDLFQVFSREDEILLPSIDVVDVEIVESFTATNIRQDI